jgi:glycine amidinotransferase
MFNVYQHWDPLKICVVGRSYPPEFYSWITVPHVRSLFEKIAIETEEDYQDIIKKLQQFGVEVLRPELPSNTIVNGKYIPPPMTPRDYTVMVGDIFYENYSSNFSKMHYHNIKDPAWPKCSSWHDFDQLPEKVKRECKEIFNFGNIQTARSEYDKIFDRIKANGNTVKSGEHSYVNGAQLARIGQDLYFGTNSYNQDLEKFSLQINEEFKLTRNHIVNTGGHADGTYCPVCPGLIISLKDVPTYADTFPGWEVVYLPGQSWNAVQPFLKLKQKNKGKWWIPGFEHDQGVIDTVETWLGHWTGYVEETVFDVNMLIIDPKNVMVFNYNKQVFDALDRYGITPHVVPFRHRYFWDGGIHCVTSDLHREGTMQDYFPQRS